jgi:endoglucanase
MDRRSFLASCAAALPALKAAGTEAPSRLRAGINLGTWISQYQHQKTPNFDTRVQERDLDQIASWGMDHVRLPIDSDFFEDDATPGVYREERMAYADRTIQWAKKNGLALILDLHRAPGYFFGDLGKNRLFTEPAMQDRYLAIWRMFAKRYRAEGDTLVFELLNEVVEATPDQWNGLVRRAVNEIRSVDPNRWIIVGGIHYNAIEALDKIAILEEPRIICTFHYYHPMLVTHQKAGWVKQSMDYDKFTAGQRVDYPGTIPKLAEFVEAYPNEKSLRSQVGVRYDLDWMRKDMQPAADFVKATRKPLYCGEYGVIRHASIGTRRRWHEDVSSICRELGIGRAAWSYKDGSFLFVDADTSKPVDMDLVRIASRK